MITEDDLRRSLRQLADEAPVAQRSLDSPHDISRVARPIRPRNRARWSQWAPVLAVVVVLAIAVPLVVLSATGRHAHRPPVQSPGTLPSFAIETSAGIDALAVGGSMLYVASGDVPDATLSVYDRASGQLIRRIRVPALPRALRVGPGGTVWLTFYADQYGGPSGLWLLSANLGQRSIVSPRTARLIGLSDVLPVDSTHALVVDNHDAHGLADLTMPIPGHAGRPTLRPALGLRADHGYAGAVMLGRVAGRIVALQEDVTQNFRLALAGPHGMTFDPGHGVDINSMAAGASGLWLTTGVQPTGASTGAVIRLDDRLRPVTPPSISRNRALRLPQQVEISGDTVVISTDNGDHPLVCFRYKHTAGPVTDIPVRNTPGDLAVAGNVVYVTDASGLTAYRIPVACRE